MKGIPSVMTPETLSGWTTATRYAGIAPKSFPTSRGDAYYDQVFKINSSNLTEIPVTALP
jgi:hypothetical protein